ncbi:MAG: hypothetical protein V1256_06075 [Candidatus Neomarinimicrobiota bacterium]|nr:hypothetical protein [Candidatus Neomarinimicrobiota bacterium]MEE1506503.1 hypothetical protein [Candidatus Neomarinimicrobiota bacterium]MEE1573017.1 hypothetical protein [Candidatus Neomarinimicrobiota bacterium]
MPTWYVDIQLPLLQERYDLEGMVDSVQIFLTPDSGMQLVFEDTLPSTSIDPDWLEVPVGAEIVYAGTPTNISEEAVVTTINVSIPFASEGLIDINQIPFTVPPASDRQISAEIWNNLVANFNEILLPDTAIDLSSFIVTDELPFITEISGLMIQDDGSSDSSYFFSSITNNGMLTDVTDVRFIMLTGASTSPNTLANHEQSTVLKNDTFTKTTTIGGQQLEESIRMLYDFDVSPHGNDEDTLTISAGDSVQINCQIRIRIAGIDTAVVEIAEYNMPTELAPVIFPSTIEIYSGIFKTGTSSGINEIVISNLRSSYPFYMDFIMDFRNFVPPPSGGDPVKVDTALFKDYATYSDTFRVDGYTFLNPAGADSALSKLDIDLTVRLREQTAYMPMDGSELGNMTINVDVESLHFESLEANIIKSFPPSVQDIDGMPSGFSGMTFTAVQFEFDMVNQIDLPVALDVDMIGVNTIGDTSQVAVRAAIAQPSDYGSDSTKTIIRLSKLGTTVLSYATANASTWTDSVTTPPAEGTSTIVDLMSFNPATITVNSASRIHGEGVIVAGATIGGTYRMIAPFEVRMDSMTFIPVARTPIDEVDHSTRNRIRSTLSHAALTTHVVNSIVDGELSILHSNSIFFPLDTTTEMLAIYRDTLIAHEDLLEGEDLYVVTNCEAMNLDSGDVYIFNVMDDFSKCVDGLVYLVKSSGSSVDTLVSYIDTLTTIILPKPTRFYGTAPPVYGSASTPGDTTHSSIMSAEKIRLLTDFGDHFVVPRFRLNGDTLAFLSTSDNIDVTSTLTFRISSTGMLEEAQDEIVITYPNGGETLSKGQNSVIRWKTFGEISTVKIGYYNVNPDSTITNFSIASDTANVDSFLWSVPDATLNKVRIYISDLNSSVSDSSGWFFKIE